MKFMIIHVGKTSDKGLKSFIAEFQKRLKRFASLEIKSVDGAKGKRSSSEIKDIEAAQIARLLSTSDHVILLDEKGRDYNSRSFAELIDAHFLHNFEANRLYHRRSLWFQWRNPEKK